jgi:hypothetical protein
MLALAGVFGQQGQIGGDDSPFLVTDDEERESRRAERRIARVERAAGEGAEVEYLEPNQERQDRDANGEGAPLDVADEPDSGDGDR